MRPGVSPARCALLALALLGTGTAASCAHDFTVENRETPVHVWITAPELAERGGTVQALVYVGSEKAVEGPVRFPRGVPHVVLPTLYLSTGEKTVSAVLGGGAVSATEEVEIEQESWIQIVLRGRHVEILLFERQPTER